MIAQQSSDTQPVNIKAAAWTVGVHIVLLLLFVLIRYNLPAAPPPVQEMGMEVNLGTDADGSGNDQPMATGDPAPDRASARYQAAAQQNAEARDMAQTDDPDAPEVRPVQPNNASVRNNNTQTTTATRNRNNQQASSNNTQQQHPRYVYNGATGNGGNGAVTDRPGTSEGNTTGNGDRGVPNGTPGAANYTGSPGNGNGGISHTLFGRSISPAQFQAEFHEGGRVVVQVKVDRDGNILEKRIKSSPSAELSRIALQKLSQARFSKNASAAPEQFGTVTIVFKARS
jgi:TonB family protein